MIRLRGQIPGDISLHFIPSEHYREPEFRSKKGEPNIKSPEIARRIEEYRKKMENGEPLWEESRHELTLHKQHIKKIKTMMKESFRFKEAAEKLGIEEDEVRTIYAQIKKELL